ncbi:unnamed protein product, partial [Prorocentrum cordatum]
FATLAPRFAFAEAVFALPPSSRPAMQHRRVSALSALLLLALGALTLSRAFVPAPLQAPARGGPSPHAAAAAGAAAGLLSAAPAEARVEGARARQQFWAPQHGLAEAGWWRTPPRSTEANGSQLFGARYTGLLFEEIIPYALVSSFTILWGIVLGFVLLRRGAGIGGASMRAPRRLAGQGAGELGDDVLRCSGARAPRPEIGSGRFAGKARVSARSAGATSARAVRDAVVSQLAEVAEGPQAHEPSR